MLTLSRRRLLAAAVPLAAAKALRAAEVGGEAAFPADFVWGASTSSYQIEGAVAADGRGLSIWDTFSHTPGNVKGGDTGDVACDHYHRWRDDIELIRRGGFGAYRFSVAWPRVLPTGAGAVEPRGLDFYDRLVDRLIERGITPWLCLYHWDLPQALQDRGGWLHRDIAETFADYARIVARRLGDRVTHWAMLNEANVHAIFGHGVAQHAPGLRGLPNMFAAMHHQNLAQGRAMQALRAERATLRLGSIMSLQPVRPSSASDDDRRAAARFDAMWNGASLDPLLEGAYPALVARDFAPLVASGDAAVMRQRPDFIGVNYYAPMYIAAAPQILFGAWFGAMAPELPRTAMDWPIDASGLNEILIRVRDRLGAAKVGDTEMGDVEIYVTENGACFSDTVAADGTVRDDDRIAYLRDHLAAVRQALAAGAGLRGYFVWSLLDNFEWQEGYGRRFGVVHVDFTTQKRTPKASLSYLMGLMKR